MKAAPPEIVNLIKRYDPEIQALIHATRDSMLGSFPGATETPDETAGLLGYGYGPGYKGTVATLILSKTGVKIGIPYGTLLRDPAHLLTGKGKVHRHVAIKKAAELDAPALKSLLKQALDGWRMRSQQKN